MVTNFSWAGGEVSAVADLSSLRVTASSRVNVHELLDSPAPAFTTHPTARNGATLKVICSSYADAAALYAALAGALTVTIDDTAPILQQVILTGDVERYRDEVLGWVVEADVDEVPA